MDQEKTISSGKNEKKVFSPPASLKDVPMHYCPGCHHGIYHRLVAEAIDIHGIREDVIGVSSVGCSVFIYDYLDVDIIQPPHGRAPAVATGVKRARPGSIVFCYQGDGDLAAIGTSEIIHAANRGEKITVIFINNTIYGMTGGQMAPTTLLGQKTATSPYGRDFRMDGYPIRMSEMIATLEGTAYVARVAVDTPKNLNVAKKVIAKAFEVQMKGLGLSFVECLSTCPTDWGMTPIKANERVKEELIPYFPLGVFKERESADFL